MELFTRPVREMMVAPVHTIGGAAKLKEAQARMAKFYISALPVVDEARKLVGVISRTDLLKVGRMRALNGFRRRALTLPDARVSEFMTSEVQVVGPNLPIHEAASRITRQHIHRLYVSEGYRLLGVVGTVELLGVVDDAALRTPLESILNRGIIVVQGDDPLSLAVDRLAASDEHALVVMEAHWPIGLFTQAEAFAARDAHPGDTVDIWMDPSLVCLPAAIPAYRAAHQARAVRARAVLGINGNGVRGIATGIDFAKLVKLR